MDIEYICNEVKKKKKEGGGRKEKKIHQYTDSNFLNGFTVQLCGLSDTWCLH